MKIDDLSRIKYEVEAFFIEGNFDLYEDGRFLCGVAPAQCAAEISFGKLVFLGSGDGWSRSWRILACETSTEGLRLHCTGLFGRMPGTLELRRGPAPAEAARSRVEFARRIGALIEANLAGVKVESIRTARDDSRHLSGVYARLQLKEGKGIAAAIATSERDGQGLVDASLGAGLIWINELRRRGVSVNRLSLFVPKARAFTLACRLLYVQREDLRISLYEVDEAARRITVVAAFAQADLLDGLRRAARRADWGADGIVAADASQRLPEVRKLAPEWFDRRIKNGWLYLSFCGLTFARVSTNRARLEFGLESPRRLLSEKNRLAFDELIDKIVSCRKADSEHKNELFFRAQPERWLESILLKDIRAIDSDLDSRHVYSQIPAYRGEQRSFIDLLTVTSAGRLVVIELKVSEDSEFPFQGLDYWLRVDWHRRRGDFERRGYFKHRSLIDKPPLIYLVAPLFRFHATTKLLAGVIAKEAPVYRLGINEDWRSGVRVLLRERLNR